MAIICFIVGLLIIGVSLGFAVKNRHNTKKWIACITAGVFFSTFFMILPTTWIKEGQSVSLPLLYRITSSLFYGFKVLGGRPELAQIESVPLEGWLKSIYIGINYLSFIAAPVLAASWLLSFFGDTLQRIRYWLRITPKCCIFSELNENAIVLADSIKKECGRETIVFCNTKNSAADLAERARMIGGILLYKPCNTVNPSWRFDSFEYYLISETEDVNIKCAESIICRENKRKKRIKPIIVNTFFKTSTKIEVLESLASEKETNPVQLRFINEISLFCNDLVFRHPLYDLPNKRKDISVMVVGCGSWGMQMLKTVISNGQIYGYRLKIRVYDSCAEHIKDMFYHQCPEFKNLNADLEFIRADIRTDDFFEKTEKHSLDATYVCVATSSDDMNLVVSENLYRFFRRKNGFSYTPSIFVRVKNDIITDNLTEKNDSFLKQRKIELFGTSKSFYSDKTLFNTRLEKLSLGVHLCYCGALEKGKGNEDFDRAVKEFYELEYSRRSSMAVALHFGAKIVSCLEAMFDNGKISEDDLHRYKNALLEHGEIPENILAVYEEQIADENMFECLMRNEHERWIYYMATQGIQSVTMDDVRKYYNQDKNKLSHKDEKLSKSHPCLIPFDELDALSAGYNALANLKGNDKRDFKNEDAKMIEMLPMIVRFANETH